MSACEYGQALDQACPPALPTPKPREYTAAIEQGEIVISRSPRQRWIDMCWQLLGMQRDIAQRQVHGPGTGKSRP